MYFKNTSANYSCGIIAICLLYFVIQFFYVSYAALSVDDFWLAFHTFQYKSALPYRDFAPYKTILGYYLLVIPMSFFHGVLTPLINTKIFVASINTGFLLLTSLWLKKFFSSLSVLTGLVLAVSTHFFLSYASEIRVDMLAFWLCLICVLWLFENKYTLAGASLGIGFLVSQKALWHIFAIDTALIGGLLFNHFSSFKQKQNAPFLTQCKNIFVFNLFILLPIVIYIGVWSYYSSFHTVMRSMFYEAYLVSAIDSYNHYRLAFWEVSIENNPLFFLLWPLALLSLIVVPANDKNFSKRFFLMIYTTVTSIMIIRYKQPFLYNMTVLIPPYFLLYTAFFSWLYDIYQETTFKLLFVSRKLTMLFIGIYVSAILLVVCQFSLLLAYLMICFFPLLLARYLFSHAQNNALLKNASFTVIILITLFTGVIYPLTHFMGSLDEMNGHYQKYMMNLANTLLQGGGDYLAGEMLFYNRDQPVNGLKHIGVASLEYLYQPKASSREFMQLDSLYSSADNVDQIIASLKDARIKFFVNNNRFIQLPPKIKDYLLSEYQHFWGSIYLYAPVVKATEDSVFVKFDGRYKLESKKAVVLDGKPVSPNAFIELSVGNHTSRALYRYRLRFIPQNVAHPLNPSYQKDDWQRLLF
ncbi:MAG: hypothetical protein P4M14_12465 [Gammaproteobacteria bacterium]|nr:hypothetical protein [Gammaproteobacteria bacterium]